MADQPAVVIDALLAAPKGVAGVTLRPLTMAQYLVLQKRGHPAVTKESPELSKFEMLELAFVLGTAARDVVRSQQEGDEVWIQEVVAFAENVRMDEFDALREEVQRILREAYAPAPPASSQKKKI